MSMGYLASVSELVMDEFTGDEILMIALILDEEDQCISSEKAEVGALGLGKFY